MITYHVVYTHAIFIYKAYKRNDYFSCIVKRRISQLVLLVRIIIRFELSTRDHNQTYFINNSLK